MATSTNSLAAELGVSGVSVGVATLTTNPFDVVKTRLQLQSLKTANQEKSPGLVRTGVLLVRHEGVLALWNGLPPALARGLLYGGLRLGLYSPIKTAMAALGSGSSGSGSVSGQQKEGTNKEQVSFIGKLASGSLSGSLAAAITNPTELIKTRLQTKGNVHKGSIAVVKHIIANEGVKGLWRGSVPGMTRAALLTACQCATYDEIKHMVLRYSGWEEGLATQLTSSTLAGLVATTATNPIDVIKTVVFAGGSKVSGPWAAAVDIWKSDGPKGFLKGWVANFARLGPQTIVAFVVCEYLRDLVGMSSI